MPATRLLVAFEEGSDLSSGDPEFNDIADYYHLGAIAYCDLAFVDSRTSDKLAKARCLPSHVHRNSKAAETLEALVG